MTDDDINNIINVSEEKNDMSFVEEHVSQLMKKFDTVQILCSRYKGGEGDTHFISTGNGNFWARYGQAKVWLKRIEADEMRREE